MTRTPQAAFSMTRLDTAKSIWQNVDRIMTLMQRQRVHCTVMMCISMMTTNETKTYYHHRSVSDMTFARSECCFIETSRRSSSSSCSRSCGLRTLLDLIGRAPTCGRPFLCCWCPWRIQLTDPTTLASISACTSLF